MSIDIHKSYIKAKGYSGQIIRGNLLLTYKIDGCRVLYKNGVYFSRNKKEYPGLSKALTSGAKEKIAKYKDCEIFINDFNTTRSLLLTHDPDHGLVKASNIYPLSYNLHSFPSCDERLVITKASTFTQREADIWLPRALNKGYEGLVLRKGRHWYRVKPDYTADVIITGYFEQQDINKKPKGILGGFTTKYGAVTAMPDNLRELFWENPDAYVGRMIEVSYKERYDTGKFRFAVKFKRFRDDKQDESFDK